MFDGSAGSDDYLMAWEWGEYHTEDGSAEEAAIRMAEKYNSGFPRDFVARVRDLFQTDTRKPVPGAVDYWIEKH